MAAVVISHPKWILAPISPQEIDPSVISTERSEWRDLKKKVPGIGSVMRWDFILL
jgi:hypothetical protein